MAFCTRVAAELQGQHTVKAPSKNSKRCGSDDKFSEGILVTRMRIDIVNIFKHQMIKLHYRRTTDDDPLSNSPTLRPGAAAPGRPNLQLVIDIDR